jgi:hypothetical protein
VLLIRKLIFKIGEKVMNEKFKRVGFYKNWEVSDTGFTYGEVFYPFDFLEKIDIVSNATFYSGFIANVFTKNNQTCTISYTVLDKSRGERAIEFLKSEIEKRPSTSKPGIIYALDGARGRHMDVYNDRVCIITKGTIGALIAGNITDGEKEIYYSDVIGVQIKAPSTTLGYIQLETASAMMNNSQDNFSNENTFTYDEGQVSPVLIDEVVSFIRSKVSECKSNKNATVIAQGSSADELKKFKELLDMGVLTQEEFDAKKKQLLGL